MPSQPPPPPLARGAARISLISAPADGIAPAVLLEADGAQYIFNAPEGFSRLVLEHKVRPSGQLRTLFAMELSSQALGGLGGLLLRLAADGHSDLEVVGPRGSAQAVHSLRHIIRWRHPQLFVSEWDGWCPSVLYQDEKVSVAAVWSQGSSGVTWQPPTWLSPTAPTAGREQQAWGAREGRKGKRQAVEGTAGQPTAVKGDASGGDDGSEGAASSSSSSSSSDENEDEVRSEGAVGEPSVAKGDVEGEDGGSESGVSRSNSSSEETGSSSSEEEAGAGGEEEQGARKDGLHGKLDALFTSSGGACRAQTIALLRGSQHQQAQGRVEEKGQGLAEQRVKDPTSRESMEESGSSSSESGSSCDDDAVESSLGGSSGNEEGGSSDSSSSSSSSGGSSSSSDEGGSQANGIGLVRGTGAIEREDVFERMDNIFGASGLKQGDMLRLMKAAGNTASSRSSVSERATDVRAGKAGVVAEPGMPTLDKLPAGGEEMAGRWGPEAASARRQSAVQCDPGGNPVFAYSSTWTQHARHTAHGRNSVSNKASVLLYVCHVAANDGVVAIIHCPSIHCKRLLSRHCAIKLLRKQPPGRLAAVFHLTDPTVASTKEYRVWAQSLPGKQVMQWSAEKEVSGAPSNLGLGHRASARTLARLNVVSWRIFPLPESLKQSSSAGGEGTAVTAAECKGVCRGAKLVQGRMLLRVDSGRATAWLPLDSSSCPDDAALLAVDEDHRSMQTSTPDIRKELQRCSALSLVSTSGLCRWKPPPLAPPQPPPLPSQQRLHAGFCPSYCTPPPAAPLPPPPVLPPPNGIPPSRSSAPAAASNRAAADLIRAKLMAATRGGGTSKAEAGTMEEGHQTVEVAGRRKEEKDEEEDGSGRLSEEELSQVAHMPDFLRNMQAGGELAEVAFLGTGSAEPSKHRGPSAIHLRLRSAGLLLDCGENTMGQLRRAHGIAGATAEVAALSAVWISHKHADHCLGLTALLAARPPSCCPLLIVGPWAVRSWLQEVAPHLALTYSFAHCAEFNNALHPLRGAALGMLGLERWLSVPVHHCRDAWGLVLQSAAGWKVVYSGDTRPCLALQRAGRGATLLIHEATFEAELQEQACRKRHSTTEEALEAAAKMGAYRTVLTHFSQRYPGIPQGLPLAEVRLQHRPVVAFDGMRIPLAALPELPLLMPLIAAVIEYRPEESAVACDGNGFAVKVEVETASPSLSVDSGD